MTPSLVDVASSADRLSKLTVSGDRTRPVSSDLARARTPAIATAAATAKATLDDSVKRAYVKLPYKDVCSISVLPFPTSLNKSNGAQQVTRSVKSAMSVIPMRCDDRYTEGVRSPTWVPGWDHPLHMATLIDVFFGQVPRAMAGGESGPEAFTLLLRLLTTHFDRVDTGEGYIKLHTFGVCNGTPFCDFSREFRVPVSTATGSECVLSPGTDVVLEVVRMAVNEQFPTLMPTLYPGSKATDPWSYASLDAMRRVFGDSAHKKTPAVNGEKYFSLPVSSTGARPSATSGPRPADHGRGHGRVPSQSLSWQMGSSHHPTVMPIDDSSDPWLDQTSNCWPLEEHHYAEVFAVSASFKTDDPPLWSGLLSPSTHADALRENRGLCLNCHQDNHSFKHCWHSFIDASGCLNPELGQLGDDDAYRRWQARMICYCRDGKPSRPNKHKRNRRHHSGQSRGYHQDQGQINCHNNNTYTSDQHGGIPPSPASSAPAPAPGMRFGVAHNRGGNPNARQPGTFRTGI